MKGAIFIISLLTSVTSQAALLNFTCTTEVGKPVTINLLVTGTLGSRVNPPTYKVQNFIIDREDYGNIAQAGRGSYGNMINMVIDTYKTGEKLYAVIENDPRKSYYYLGGFSGTLDCRDTTPKSYPGL